MFAIGCNLCEFLVYDVVYLGLVEVDVFLCSLLICKTLQHLQPIPSNLSMTNLIRNLA